MLFSQKLLFFILKSDKTSCHQEISKMVPSFHVCLFCCKLREKSTLVNIRESFRENAKTKFIFQPMSGGGATRSRPVIKCLMTTSQFIPVFPIGAVLQLVRNENLNYDFHFNDTFGNRNEFFSIISSLTMYSAVLCSLVLYSVHVEDTLASFRKFHKQKQHL
jgi:hypothetical protein